MTATASPTAAPQARATLGTSVAQATPTMYDSTLPASTGHGWARGLDGIAMMSTALEPREATIHGTGRPAPNQCANSATTATQSAIPDTMRKRSR